TRRFAHGYVYFRDSECGGRTPRRGLLSPVASMREKNLVDVLRRRATELAPPLQICDALSRNAPAAFLVILANCLAHGRRHFVDVVKNFPVECRYVLEALREVFHFDA